jgi:hypothetical protein
VRRRERGREREEGRKRESEREREREGGKRRRTYVHACSSQGKLRSSKMDLQSNIKPNPMLSGLFLLSQQQFQSIIQQVMHGIFKKTKCVHFREGGRGENFSTREKSAP